MPKKKIEESPADQSKRFQRFAQDMIDAGELNRTEAELGLDGVVRSSQPRNDTNSSE